jgi:Protein of unknown function (DUF3618)
MSPTTEKGAGRDPDDLEREADQIRADMNRTLDALERKFSPGQLLDRSLVYLREHGGDWTRNVGETVRRNPVPVLMTVAGITWLLGSSLWSRTREQSPLLEGEIEDELDDDFIGDDFTDEPGDEPLRAGRFQEGVAATRERAQHVQQRVSSLMDEQPLAFGAIAVAIGAIIGAAIPTTAYENRTVGQMRDRALAKARQMGERQYENLRSKLETHEEVQVSGQAH